MAKESGEVTKHSTPQYKIFREGTDLKRVMEIHPISGEAKTLWEEDKPMTLTVLAICLADRKGKPL